VPIYGNWDVVMYVKNQIIPIYVCFTYMPYATCKSGQLITRAAQTDIDCVYLYLVNMMGFGNVTCRDV
jgi:hypothetical protein